MPFLNILILIIVIGFLLYLVNNYLPMDGKIKKILNVVVVVDTIIWLLKAFAIINF